MGKLMKEIMKCDAHLGVGEHLGDGDVCGVRLHMTLAACVHTHACTRASLPRRTHPGLTHTAPTLTHTSQVHLARDRHCVRLLHQRRA